MATVPIHSLIQDRIVRAAKSAIAGPFAAVATMQRVVPLTGWVMRLYRHHRSRRQLAALDSRLLADIGISETQRRAELGKPFWKTGDGYK